MWTRFIKHDGGAPAIEFAIVSPVLILMALGVANLGLAFATRLQVEAELNSIQLESLRNTVADAQSITQQRMQAMVDGIGGLSLTGAVSVSEAYGCPDAVDSDAPIEAGRQEDDSCTCAGETCSPYRYFVIAANMRYSLPFGLSLDLPFLDTGDTLSAVDIAATRTIMVDGGWQ